MFLFLTIKLIPSLFRESNVNSKNVKCNITVNISYGEILHGLEQPIPNWMNTLTKNCNYEEVYLK